MTVEEVNKVLKDKSMKSKETNFKVLEDGNGGKITLAKFYKEFLEFVKNQEKFNKMVSNQFKKHGWTK